MANLPVVTPNPIPTFKQPITDDTDLTTRPWYFFFQSLYNRLNTIVSGITITDGTHTVSGATNLSVTGATVGGTSPNASLTVSGGGGSLAVTDGTHTVSPATNVTFAGTTVSGTTPNAVVTLPASALFFNITTDSHLAVPTGVGLGPNDEFETGSGIDTAGTRYPGAVAWTGFNISTATNQVNNGALVLRPVNSGGLTINGYVQPVILAGTWTYEAKVTSANLTANGAVGLIVGAAGGKFIFFNISGTGGAVMNVQAFTNATTFSTTQQALGTVVALGSYIYLQISYTGTNLIFSYSASGTPGSFINGFSQTPAFFLGAVPTVIGIAGSLQNTIQGQLVCDWFRQVA